MSSQLKISADTSAVKKSILDISKSMKDLKGSKISVFSSEDKKFIKQEFKKEMSLMKAKLKENREEISKMVAEQKHLVKGSEEELEHRKKILEAYKIQAKLAKELGSVQKSGGGGFMGAASGFMKSLPGLMAMATIGYAVHKGVQANDQYKAGASNRNKLLGLGGDQNFGSSSELARVGLTEQDMIQRRIDATSVLGRSGTSNDTEMRKAGFERAFGLNSGTMTGIAGQLRGSMGGSGATDAQMKLQASVFAAGIEDAIGPYLDSATQLLKAINDTGTTQTAEITGLLAQLTKDGERTPELLAKTFAGINDSVKGATGENSAFLQTAFARAGIGGGTLGGTKFSMASGGIMGQDRASLEKRGYNKDLLDSMEKSGMFAGVGKRSGAILDMFRQSGGLGSGESISGIKDTDRMVGMGNLANSVFGTKGDQGFDALMMLEKVQNKQMTQKQFDEKLKGMQESQDPSLQRLDKINSTLSGQTEILENIRTNQMEALGKEAVVGGNQLVRMDTEGIAGVKDVAGLVNNTGAPQAIGNAAVGASKYMRGGIGGDLYDKFIGKPNDKLLDAMSSDDTIVERSKRRYRSGEGFKGASSEQEVEARVRESLKRQRELTAKDIGKEVSNALRTAPLTVNSKFQMPDGKVVDRTNK